MKVYLNEVNGIADAITTMYFSKRSWTREVESHIREVCDFVMDRHGHMNPYDEENRQHVADGRGYYMDIGGSVYLYLDEHNCMVHICGAEAFCKDGSAATYQAGKARSYRVIEMEEAIRLMDLSRNSA